MSSATAIIVLWRRRDRAEYSLSTGAATLRQSHSAEKGPMGDGSSTRAGGIITGLLWSETGVLVRKISLALFRGCPRICPITALKMWAA